MAQHRSLNSGSFILLVVVLVVLVTILLIALIGAGFIRKKNMHIWLWGYLWSKIKRAPRVDGPIHLMFCFVDHYEPRWGRPNSMDIERARVDRWHQEYPQAFGHIKDADGCLPKHSFFYPEEEYEKEHLDKIADLCAKGFGELEIHLHHENDTSDNLRTTLLRFAQTLNQEHGALAVHPSTGELAYAFIHGNWALDNCHPEGKWCGVNDEITVLKETGCYADFTLPSAPSETQTSTVNSIYYATDDPLRPKSHDKGERVRVGGSQEGDLMIIQGPLCLNWKERKWGILPRIETGDIRKSIPPSKQRVDMWVDQHIHVEGRPEWGFVKIHTHGTQEMDIDTLLGKPTVNMYEYLASRYNDGNNYVMHFVSSREMYNIIKAAEAGKQGNPNAYRDFCIPRPAGIN